MENDSGDDDEWRMIVEMMIDGCRSIRYGEVRG